MSDHNFEEEGNSEIEIVGLDELSNELDISTFETLSDHNFEEEGNSEIEIVGLDELDDELNISTFETLKLKRQETDSFVQKLRARVAGWLAVSLWAALILTGWWQTHMVGIITTKILENENSSDSGSEPDFEAYDKASAMVGDTSKTLYAVISPLATAITGFYFVLRAEKSGDDEDNDEI